MSEKANRQLKASRKTVRKRLRIRRAMMRRLKGK
jgi:hypothetical protein